MIYDQNEPRREQRESDCRQVLTEHGMPETAGRLLMLLQIAWEHGREYRSSTHPDIIGERFGGRI